MWTNFDQRLTCMVMRLEASVFASRLAERFHQSVAECVLRYHDSKPVNQVTLYRYLSPQSCHALWRDTSFGNIFTQHSIILCQWITFSRPVCLLILSHNNRCSCRCLPYSRHPGKGRGEKVKREKGRGWN